MRGSDAFHLALIVLCCVGFLALYFKVDLDGSLNATYVAKVSQQVAGVEKRVMKLEKAMGAGVSSSASLTAFGETTWNGLKISAPQRAIDQQIVGSSKLILTTTGMSDRYCGGASTEGCIAGMTIVIEEIFADPSDLTFAKTLWSNIKVEELDGVKDPMYILTTKSGKKFSIIMSGAPQAYESVINDFDLSGAEHAVLTSLAKN